MGFVRCYSIALVLLCLLLVVDLSLTQSCGTRKGVKFRIVNGSEAKDGYWPWHVALFHNISLSLGYACGGTILNQNTVLTAAHCLMTTHGIIAREHLVLQMGRHHLGEPSNRVQEHEALELILHPEYNVNGVQHDIALIKLVTNITYTNYIHPICLWNRGEDLCSIIGWGTVVGFGIDGTDNVSNTLLEARIPVVSHITCIESNREVFATQLTSNMFCAGNRDGISACNGDSGGGLFFNYSDVWYIRGVVSFTKPRQHENNCDTKEYTAFTDVAKYLRWIEKHIRGTGGEPVVTMIDENPKIRLLPTSTCGANPYASREETSKPVLLGYPWVGLVQCDEIGSRAKIIFCHATLISDLYLISGAHCEIGISESVECLSPSVRLGEYDRNTLKDCAEVDGEMVCSPPVQTLRIESTIKHKDYKNDIFTNNIALIRLRDRADTSQSNVKPICLPVTSELRSQKSTHYTLTSWKYLNMEMSNLLESWQSEHIDSTECQNLFKQANLSHKITTRHICIKQSYGPDCKSALPGAPLQLVQQVQGKSRYVLHGMLTFIWKKCETLVRPGVKEVYTNVASYVDWILENMQE